MESLRQSSFVNRVNEREQKADCTRVDVTLDDLAHSTRDCVLGQCFYGRAGRRHPLRHLETQLPRHQRHWIVLLQIIKMWSNLPADLDKVAESFSSDQRNPAAAPFDQGVGRHGRAVAQPED